MKRLTNTLLAAGASVLANSPAFAESMPQMQFGNKLLQAQVIWGAFIFAGFYWAVSRIGLPKVANILEMRAATIARDLNQARDARAHAEAAVRELNEARHKAHAQSQAALTDAMQHAKAEAEARAAEQEARLDAQLAESESRIGAAREAAMGSLETVATETAQAVLTRLTHREADHGAVQDAVRRALADRGLDRAA